MKRFVISTKLTNRANDSFNQYLKEIAAIDIFTPEEEAICTEKASRGDIEAINELVNRNLRFVVSVAKQYATAQNPLEDLVNEGNVGLIIAAEKFKPEMGFKFISYGVWWIRKVIIEHLTKNGRLVRIPANKVNNLSKLDKQINKLEQKLGRNVSVQELIDEFKSNLGVEEKNNYKKVISEYEFLDVLNNYKMDSLDRDISGDDNGGTSLGETISDLTFESADQFLIDQDTKIQLNKLLGTLKPRDQKVIVGLFGLDGDFPKTLKDISDEIGVTREMVRQIKEKSLDKLRKQIIGTVLDNR